VTDWVAFEGAVEPVVWGKATYTVLRLPEAVVEALGSAKRVEGEINEHWVNLALSRAPVVEGVFLWAGSSLLDRLGVEPGETLEVRLRPAPDDQVDTPEDVALALRAADMTAEWEGLTAGKRRGMLYQIGTAKTAATRAKRIDAMIQSLR
jgi:hypothetical protein